MYTISISLNPMTRASEKWQVISIPRRSGLTRYLPVTAPILNVRQCHGSWLLRHCREYYRILWIRCRLPEMFKLAKAKSSVYPLTAVTQDVWRGLSFGWKTPCHSNCCTTKTPPCSKSAEGKSLVMKSHVFMWTQYVLWLIMIRSTNIMMQFSCFPDC